jgi:hypothetical protein
MMQRAPRLMMHYSWIIIVYVCVYVCVFVRSVVKCSRAFVSSSL